MSKIPLVQDLNQSLDFKVPCSDFNPPELKFTQQTYEKVLSPKIQQTFDPLPRVKFIKQTDFVLPDIPSIIQLDQTVYKTNQDIISTQKLSIPTNIYKNVDFQVKEPATEQSLPNPLQPSKRIINVVKYDPLIQIQQKDDQVQIQQPVSKTLLKNTYIKNQVVMNNNSVDEDENSLSYLIMDAQKQDFGQLGYKENFVQDFNFSQNSNQEYQVNFMTDKLQKQQNNIVQIAESTPQLQKQLFNEQLQDIYNVSRQLIPGQTNNGQPIQTYNANGQLIPGQTNNGQPIQTYDANRQLIPGQTNNGQPIQTYDANGQLIPGQTNNGQPIQTYDANRQLIPGQTNNGQPIQTYDAKGQLIPGQANNGQPIQTYDANRQLIPGQTNNGQPIQTYDANRQLIPGQTNNGQPIQTYDANGQLIPGQANNGQPIQTYDANRQLIPGQTNNGQPIQTYDANGQLIPGQANNGQPIQTYDAKGQLIPGQTNNGQPIQTYDANGQLIPGQTNNGQPIQTYDAKGQLIPGQTNNGQPIQTYDAKGQLIPGQTNNGQPIQTYDANGQLIPGQANNGQPIQTYDAKGQLIPGQANNGQPIQTYDAKGQLIPGQTNNGQPIQTYNANGQLIPGQTNNGQPIQTYDANGQLIPGQANNGQPIQTYDAKGQLIPGQTNNGQPIQTYDAKGQLIPGQTNNGQPIQTYDAKGQLIPGQTNNGQPIQTYDAKGQLIPGQANNGQPIQTYDAKGQLIPGQANNGQPIQTYDAKGQLIPGQTNNGQPIQTYDANGQLIPGQTNNGQPIQTYDANGQLIPGQANNGQPIQTYDAKGQLIPGQANNGQPIQTYDAKGQLIPGQTNNGQPIQTYDAKGQLIPGQTNNGQPIQTYDANGQLIPGQTNNGQPIQTYDANGQLIPGQANNGQPIQTYDAKGQLIPGQANNGQPIQTYDAKGQLIPGQTNNGQPIQTYDAKGQLIPGQTNNGQPIQTYDANGQLIPGQTNNGQPIQTYDANGQLIPGQANNGQPIQTYDANGQLIPGQTNNGQPIQTYDANGQLIPGQANNGQPIQTYDANGQLIPGQIQMKLQNEDQYQILFPQEKVEYKNNFQSDANNYSNLYCQREYKDISQNAKLVEDQCLPQDQQLSDQDDIYQQFLNYKIFPSTQKSIILEQTNENHSIKQEFFNKQIAIDPQNTQLKQEKLKNCYNYINLDNMVQQASNNLNTIKQSIAHKKSLNNIVNVERSNKLQNTILKKDINQNIQQIEPNKVSLKQNNNFEIQSQIKRNLREEQTDSFVSNNNLILGCEFDQKEDNQSSFQFQENILLKKQQKAQSSDQLSLQTPIEINCNQIDINNHNQSNINIQFIQQQKQSLQTINAVTQSVISLKKIPEQTAQFDILSTQYQNNICNQQNIEKFTKFKSTKQLDNQEYKQNLFFKQDKQDQPSQLQNNEFQFVHSADMSNLQNVRLQSKNINQLADLKNFQQFANTSLGQTEINIINDKSSTQANINNLQNDQMQITNRHQDRSFIIQNTQFDQQKKQDFDFQNLLILAGQPVQSEMSPSIHTKFIANERLVSDYKVQIIQPAKSLTEKDLVQVDFPDQKQPQFQDFKDNEYIFQSQNDQEDTKIQTQNAGLINQDFKTQKHAQISIQHLNKQQPQYKLVENIHTINNNFSIINKNQNKSRCLETDIAQQDNLLYAYQDPSKSNISQSNYNIENNLFTNKNDQLQQQIISNIKYKSNLPQMQDDYDELYSKIDVQSIQKDQDILLSNQFKQIQLEKTIELEQNHRIENIPSSNIVIPKNQYDEINNRFITSDQIDNFDVKETVCKKQQALNPSQFTENIPFIENYQCQDQLKNEVEFQISDEYQNQSLKYHKSSKDNEFPIDEQIAYKEEIEIKKDNPIINIQKDHYFDENTKQISLFYQQSKTKNDDQYNTNVVNIKPQLQSEQQFTQILAKSNSTAHNNETDTLVLNSPQITIETPQPIRDIETAFLKKQSNNAQSDEFDHFLFIEQQLDKKMKQLPNETICPQLKTTKSTLKTQQKEDFNYTIQQTQESTTHNLTPNSEFSSNKFNFPQKQTNSSPSIIASTTEFQPTKRHNQPINDPSIPVLTTKSIPKIQNLTPQEEDFPDSNCIYQHENNFSVTEKLANKNTAKPAQNDHFEHLLTTSQRAKNQQIELSEQRKFAKKREISSENFEIGQIYANSREFVEENVQIAQKQKGGNDVVNGQNFKFNSEKPVEIDTLNVFGGKKIDEIEPVDVEFLGIMMEQNEQKLAGNGEFTSQKGPEVVQFGGQVQNVVVQNNTAQTQNELVSSQLDRQLASSQTQTEIQQQQDQGTLTGKKQTENYQEGKSVGNGQSSIESNDFDDILEQFEEQNFDQTDAHFESLKNNDEFVDFGVTSQVYRVNKQYVEDIVGQSQIQVDRADEVEGVSQLQVRRGIDGKEKSFQGDVGIQFLDVTSKMIEMQDGSQQQGSQATRSSTQDFNQQVAQDYQLTQHNNSTQYKDYKYQNPTSNLGNSSNKQQQYEQETTDEYQQYQQDNTDQYQQYEEEKDNVTQQQQIKGIDKQTSNLSTVNQQKAYHSYITPNQNTIQEQDNKTIDIQHYIQKDQISNKNYKIKNNDVDSIMDTRKTMQVSQNFYVDNDKNSKSSKVKQIAINNEIQDIKHIKNRQLADEKVDLSSGINLMISNQPFNDVFNNKDQNKNNLVNIESFDQPLIKKESTLKVPQQVIQNLDDIQFTNQSLKPTHDYFSNSQKSQTHHQLLNQKVRQKYIQQQTYKERSIENQYMLSPVVQQKSQKFNGIQQEQFSDDKNTLDKHINQELIDNVDIQKVKMHSLQQYYQQNNLTEDTKHIQIQGHENQGIKMKQKQIQNQYLQLEKSDTSSQHINQHTNSDSSLNSVTFNNVHIDQTQKVQLQDSYFQEQVLKLKSQKLHNNITDIDNQHLDTNSQFKAQRDYPNLQELKIKQISIKGRDQFTVPNSLTQKITKTPDADQDTYQNNVSRNQSMRSQEKQILFSQLDSFALFSTQKGQKTTQVNDQQNYTELTSSQTQTDNQKQQNQETQETFIKNYQKDQQTQMNQLQNQQYQPVQKIGQSQTEQTTVNSYQNINNNSDSNFEVQQIDDIYMINQTPVEQSYSFADNHYIDYVNTRQSDKFDEKIVNYNPNDMQNHEVDFHQIGVTQSMNQLVSPKYEKYFWQDAKQQQLMKQPKFQTFNAQNELKQQEQQESFRQFHPKKIQVFQPKLKDSFVEPSPINNFQIIKTVKTNDPVKNDVEQVDTVQDQQAQIKEIIKVIPEDKMKPLDANYLIYNVNQIASLQKQYPDTILTDNKQQQIEEEGVLKIPQNVQTNDLYKQYVEIQQNIEQYPFFTTTYETCGKCKNKNSSVNKQSTDQEQQVSNNTDIPPQVDELTEYSQPIIKAHSEADRKEIQEFEFYNNREIIHENQTTKQKDILEPLNIQSIPYNKISKSNPIGNTNIDKPVEQRSEQSISLVDSIDDTSCQVNIAQVQRIQNPKIVDNYPIVQQKNLQKFDVQQIEKFKYTGNRPRINLNEQVLILPRNQHKNTDDSVLQVEEQHIIFKKQEEDTQDSFESSIQQQRTQESLYSETSQLSNESNNNSYLSNTLSSILQNSLTQDQTQKFPLESFRSDISEQKKSQVADIDSWESLIRQNQAPNQDNDFSKLISELDNLDPVKLPKQNEYISYISAGQVYPLISKDQLSRNYLTQESSIHSVGNIRNQYNNSLSEGEIAYNTAAKLLGLQ